MNKGIKQAKGEYIYFLGGDDTLYDSKVLATVNQYLELNDIDVVYGDVSAPHLTSEYSGLYSADELTRRNICHQAVFCHKRVFNKAGLFNTKYPVLADWEHNTRWFYGPRILFTLYSNNYCSL